MEGGAGGVCAVLVALGVEQVVGAGGGSLFSSCFRERFVAG